MSFSENAADETTELFSRLYPGRVRAVCAPGADRLWDLLLTGVLIANLYNLQIVRFTDYQTRSNENRIKLVPIAPSRGIIYDRNGIPLAHQPHYLPDRNDAGESR